MIPQMNARRASARGQLGRVRGYELTHEQAFLEEEGDEADDDDVAANDG